MPSSPALRLAVLALPAVLLVGLTPIGSQPASSRPVTHLSSNPSQAGDARHRVRHDIAIKTLSNRADLVSGGDVLTRILLPRGVTVRSLRVRLNGHSITKRFAKRRNHRIEGVVKGLKVGRNRLVAHAGGQGARLVITNHPIGGPAFAGPQIKPWKCEAGATNAKCDRKVASKLLYAPIGTAGIGVGISGVANASLFQKYNPKRPPPRAAIATARTITGVKVPFIVRQDTGYIDRDQFTIATLWQPGKKWKPWAPQQQFNHRMVITHGASCDTEYGSGNAPGVLDPKLLGGGFILISNALDNAGHDCNIVTQAESLVMTKEYAIDHYGPVLYTIGTGCSGGSLAQQQVANAYPGIYQGITPQCSFTDAWSSAMEYVDYSILLKYFEAPQKWGAGLVWSATAIQQVIDHPNIANPVSFTTVIPNSADPSRSCPKVPASQVYDPKTNPKGVKCTLQDYMVNVFGKKKNGFANRPFGNDGIQYGLQGLLNGEVTPAQFVDINSKVGGLTKDDTYQKARSKPDLIGLKRAYRSGAVDSANNLNRVAIIDLRGPDPGFFHDVYRTYAMRARLLRNFGTAANQVLWRGAAPLIGDATYADKAVMAMSRWLGQVHDDHRAIPLSKKIIQDKPTTLTDRCTDGAGTDVPSQVCDETVSAYGTPRIGAGMPMSDDILECHLKPLRKGDYAPIHFTGAQWSKLKQTFPQGVCNYNRRGVDQRGAIPWLTYQNRKGHVIYGGRPLGRQPASVRLKN